jgi:hypothetical protein
MVVAHSHFTGDFETVHTMTSYLDGPRGGIADYRGSPHIYESLFEDTSGDSDVFLVQPIDDETFRLAMEDWAIWFKWERAFHSGQTTQTTHPVLPEDRARHEELKALLGPRLRIQPERAFRVRARFGVCRPGKPGLLSTVELTVCWMSHEKGT